MFEQRPTSHLHDKKGCNKCRTNSTEKFVKKANEVHNGRYDYSQALYKHLKNKIKIICPVHGMFEQIPDNHLQGKGCPLCHSSKGELAIKNHLDNSNITYTLQKLFDGCKGKIRKLPFDFYLPDHNLCIEFQGIQHYEPVHYWGGEDVFKRNQLNDSIKRQFCISNNIKLLEIPYTKDPVEMLKNALDSCISSDKL